MPRIWEPDPGSVTQMDMMSRPAAKRGSQSRFCASVPKYCTIAVPRMAD